MTQKRSDRIEFLKPSGKVEMGLIDLSESGAAIIHPKEESGNANIIINNLHLKARVIYCKEEVGSFKIGMQFIDVPPEKLGFLKMLVEKFSRGVPLEFKAVFK
ncbi:PilZ domain-containing protein [Fibrobacterota bacterium]